MMAAEKSNIPVHSSENNYESESFLRENSQKFSNKCLEVLRILFTGKRLAVLEAANMGITALPRRILDIKRAKVEGVEILDEWVKDEKGKRLYKEYFLKITKRPTKAQVIEMFKNKQLVQSKLDI